MRPEIKIICDIWARAVGLQKIILFGSHARGAASPESDLDFLVVWHNPSLQTNREKAIYLRRLLPREVHVPMDLIVMTPEQYQDAISDPRTFTSLISREGKVIYESFAFDYADPISDGEAQKSLEVCKAIRDLLQPLI